MSEQTLIEKKQLKLSCLREHRIKTDITDAIGFYYSKDMMDAGLDIIYSHIEQQEAAISELVEELKFYKQYFYTNKGGEFQAYLGPNTENLIAKHTNESGQ